MINNHFHTHTDDRRDYYSIASLIRHSPRDSVVEGYDYANVYWAPADEKLDLLSQFTKLSIQRISPKDIELVKSV